MMNAVLDDNGFPVEDAEFPEELLDDALGEDEDGPELLDESDFIFDDEEDEIAFRNEQSLEALVSELESRKDRAVNHKLSIEQKWLEDERQYWGLRARGSDDEDDALDDMPVDNKTAEKVELAAARCGDMLFPTNDPNWALKPSPHSLDIDGNEIDADTAKAAVKQAGTYIADYLGQCQYAKHGRRSIHDSCRLGVGVIKGPYARQASKRVVRRTFEPLFYEDGTEMLDEDGQPMLDTENPTVELQTVVDTIPGVTHCDPWMLFLEGPVRSMDECAGAFEMHRYTPSKLATLGQLGFDEDQLRGLLEDGASLSDSETTLLTERDNILSGADNDDASANEREYVVWEYHGVIRPELLARLGLIEERDVDPLEMFWGEVWFCQGRALKADLNSILGDDRVPYYVVPYRRDQADIMNSQGVCRIMRDPQRTIDICYEAAQINTMLCSGPQVVYWDGKAVPADGSYLVDRPKTWRVTDTRVNSINDVISFTNIESSLPMIMPMYQVAVQNADSATQLPMMAHGEAANQVQQTASGLQMIFNQQNIVQRKYAHSWDDEVTAPMITRFYWWLMAWHEDDSIKIEMEVEARGASYLLVKDKQAQHLMMVMQMAASDPEMRAKLDMTELYKLTIGQMDVPVDRLFLPEDAEQAPDPMQEMAMKEAAAKLAAAEAGAGKAEAEAMIAQMTAQAMQNTGGASMGDIIRQAISADDNKTRILVAEMEREEEAMRLARNQDISWQELEAKMQDKERDRQIEVMFKEQEMQSVQARNQADEFSKGFKLRLEANEQRIRSLNMQKGFDSI